jgi:hypothetical protein
VDSAEISSRAYQSGLLWVAIATLPRCLTHGTCGPPVEKHERRGPSFQKWSSNGGSLAALVSGGHDTLLPLEKITGCNSLTLGTPFLTWDFFFFLILFPYSPYSQAHPKRIPARSNEKKKRKSPIIKRTQVQARGIFDSLLPFASPRSASAPAPAILHPSYRLPFSQLQLLLLLLALMPEPQLRRTAFSKCL